MKLFLNQSEYLATGKRSLVGTTLVEVMFASALFAFVIAAMVSAHMVGLRLDQLVESKAGASDTSRRALNQLPTDIRSAKRWFVGSFAGTTFTNRAYGTAQQGTALQLFLTTNFSNPYIVYYFDSSVTNNGKLIRTLNNSNIWTTVTLASNLFDLLYFTAEDFQGKTATNQGSSAAYKNVIHTTLDFKQFQYPLTKIGSNQLYDFYRMDFKATPHLPE